MLPFLKSERGISEGIFTGGVLPREKTAAATNCTGIRRLIVRARCVLHGISAPMYLARGNSREFRHTNAVDDLHVYAPMCSTSYEKNLCDGRSECNRQRDRRERLPYLIKHLARCQDTRNNARVLIKNSRQFNRTAQRCHKSARERIK